MKTNVNREEMVRVAVQGRGGEGGCADWGWGEPEHADVGERP